MLLIMIYFILRGGRSIELVIIVSEDEMTLLMHEILI